VALIIDTVNDSDFVTDVRVLLGVSTAELSDAAIKSKVVVTAAEGAICRIYAPNWQAVLSGSDPIALDALRNCVIVMVCINLLDNPVVQRLLFDEIKLPPDITIKNKGISVEKVKDGIQTFFEQQLALVGVERSGASALPNRVVVGKSDSALIYNYEVNDNGEIFSV